MNSHILTTLCSISCALAGLIPVNVLSNIINGIIPEILSMSENIEDTPAPRVTRSSILPSLPVNFTLIKPLVKREVDATEDYQLYVKFSGLFNYNTTDEAL